MIEAIYAVNEYMTNALTAAGLSCGDIYPGQFAPSIENDNKFVTYRVIPNDTYDLSGLKRDFVQYRFNNPDFQDLHRVIRVVRNTFNVYDIENTSLSESGIIFQETFFRVTSDGEASYAEGVDYFFVNGELTLMYVEDLRSSDNTNLFIEGV